jgi:hypothetical protein
VRQVKTHWGIIIIITAAVLLVGGALFWYYYTQPAEDVNQTTASVPKNTSTAQSGSTKSSVKLTLDILKNATYSSNDVKDFKLIDGSYSQTPAIGFDVTLNTNFVAIDDNGAAVIINLHSNQGGTGDFSYIEYQKNDNGMAKFIGYKYIDDRPDIQSVTLSNGIITVKAVVHGEKDPGCCPTQQKTLRYQIANDELVQI